MSLVSFREIHTIRFTNFKVYSSLSCDKSIQTCGYYHNEDTEPFVPPSMFSLASLQSLSSYHPQVLVTTDLFMFL